MNVNPAQINMVKQQLRAGNVLDETILERYQAYPRESFVPQTYKQFAYSDYRIPVGHQQKMFTPVEEALIIQSLALKPDECVLEIGTGSGFLTSLLSQCARHVTSVEYYAELHESAAQRLQAFGINNVSLYQGDGSRGWMERAPYDAIIITAAVKQLDDIFKLQLMKRCQLFVILGVGQSMHGCLLRLDSEEQWRETRLFETCAGKLLTPSAQQDEFDF